MSDTTPPPPPGARQQTYDGGPAASAAGPAPIGAPGQQLTTPRTTTAPVGQVRGTGRCIVLCIVTLGIYSLVWYFKTHEEMKNHSGQGIGGGLALILSLFVGFVMPFITASEVGNLYQRSGRQAPVSGATGLWVIPGAILIVGPLVWFIKTNGALNDYWRSQGAA